MIDIAGLASDVFQGIATVTGMGIFWLIFDIRKEVKEMSRQIINIRLSLTEIQAKSEDQEGKIEESREDIQRMAELIAIKQ